MTRRRRTSSRKGPAVGQADIFGVVHGLDKLVTPPEVINQDGLKVIHFAISERDRAVPGYLDAVLEQARRLEPEVKSSGKPPWMTSEWQTRKRKERAGVL